MPKRPRQAHIPSRQTTQRRKVRRPLDAAQPASQPSEQAGDEMEPVFADPPIANLPHLGAVGAVDTRPRRRLQNIQAAREGGVRVTPGQLPMFEHAFIMRELRQIALTSAALLGVIIFLAVVLR